jgi:NAD(P)H-hydrate epimerase
MTRDDDSPIPAPPERPTDAHKGTFGTVVVIGGSENMIGAPALAATAALRSGCGLARIMTWPELLPHCLTIEPSATGMAVPSYDDPNELRRAIAELSGRTVLAVGPGMSVHQAVRRGVELILQQKDYPVVLDADGLNNLAEVADRCKKPACPLVMTPHPGEFKRLARPLGIEHDPADPEQRPTAAAALAERCGAVVVLKGRHTVISDGSRHTIKTTGNPALATAGSGDILTGALAALLAQGLGLYDAAVLAVYLHGLAADLWLADHDHHPAGMMARDLAHYLPRALARHGRATAT